MKNVLVTGASGYIGQNMIRHLETKGCRSFPYDVKMREWDRANVLEYRKYDGVVHLAALSGIAACEKNHEKAVRDKVIFA